MKDSIGFKAGGMRREDGQTNRNENSKVTSREKGHRNASAFYNVIFGNPDFTSNIVSLSLGVSF
jgi:hypothetical protein